MADRRLRIIEREDGVFVSVACAVEVIDQDHQKRSRCRRVVPADAIFGLKRLKSKQNRKV